MPERWKVLSVVGTRPNFMKTVPVIRELRRRGGAFDHVLIHTGQHYDHAMWGVFVEELGVEEPLADLGVGSGTHAQQVARTVERLEPLLREHAPDVVLVPGDVNSTLGAALAAATARIPVAHIESGLRSFDPTMPEELNRRIVDQLSALLFTHSPEARTNLHREGIEGDRVFDVGNTMIDTLVAMRSRIASFDAPGRHGLDRGRYLLVTLHRPALVDTPLLEDTLGALAALAQDYAVVFPVHPRTRAALGARASTHLLEPLTVLEPVGYVEFLGLLESAAGVITDSGGVQEEAAYLRVPCFTLRDRTERPVTVELGTNHVLGLDPRALAEVPNLIAAAAARPPRTPPLWDGQASERIVDVLLSELPKLTTRPVSAARSAASVTAMVASGSGDDGSS